MSYATYENYNLNDQEEGDIESSVQELENEQHKLNIINNNKLVVVDVYANWCGPCKMVAPKFEELCKKYYKEGVCVLVKQNAENKNCDVKNIKGLPTFQFYIDGNLIDTVVGGNIAQVEENIDLFLKKQNDQN